MKFLIKNFTPIILAISVSLLIYTLYKSEIIWYGTNRDYYKTYYLISSILICFSIITFFIKDIIKEYLIISGITLIVSLYLFEGYLTFEIDLLKDRILKEKLYEKQTGNKWDKRSNLEVYKELKKKNNNITNFYIPIKFDDKSYSPYPLSGISNSETIHCNENGYYSIYQSDRYGFNNPDEEWDKKEIEYLLVGDSFTHGACVNRPNDIGSVLRNLSKKSVLNLGMSGNGPLIQYATLREYLDKNVKKIIWIYYEINDLDNLEFEIKKKNNILNKYLKDLNFTQNLKNKQNDIDSLLSNLINKEKVKAESKTFKFKFLNFIKIYNTRTFILQKSTLIPTPAHATALEFKRILQLAKELANKNNTKIYFLYLPGDMRYKKTYDDINYNLVKKIVTELKIPFIDIHIEIFKKEQNPLRLFSFGHFAHYNVDGYKKVAETIYKFTKD